MVPSPPPVLVTATLVCCFLCGWGRSIADKVCRVTVLLQDSSKVANFLLMVVLRVDDPSALSWRHLTTLLWKSLVAGPL